MNTIIPKEVKLRYQIIDDLHYFFGDDRWSVGLFAFGETYEEAEDEAMICLREMLRANYDIRCGEWEIFS